MNDILSAVIALVAAIGTGYFYSRVLKSGKQTIKQTNETKIKESKQVEKESSVVSDTESTAETSGRIFQKVHSFYTSLENSIYSHALIVSNNIEPDDSLRPSRMFGYIIQLFFLSIFTYSDIIQSFNNLALIFPSDVPSIPSWAQNLTAALLINSVGVAIAIGFLLSEFSRVTNFSRWGYSTGIVRRFSLIFIWVSLILVVIMDVVLAITRYTYLPQVNQLFSPNTVMQLQTWAPILTSLIIIPTLILTLMFMQGIVGFAVIYVLLVFVILGIVKVFHRASLTIVAGVE